MFITCLESIKFISAFDHPSEHTKKPTEDFFQSNGYFGLQSGQIVFFEQRMIPCFDLNGKIILESRSKVARLVIEFLFQ